MDKSVSEKQIYYSRSLHLNVILENYSRSTCYSGRLSFVRDRGILREAKDAKSKVKLFIRKLY